MTTTVFADWQVGVAEAAAKRERHEAQLAEVAPLCGTMDEERTSPDAIEARERLLDTPVKGRVRGSRPNERFIRPVVLTFLSTECRELVRRYPKQRHFIFPPGSTITRVADNRGRSFVVRSKDGRQWVRFDLRPGGQYVLVNHGGFDSPTGRGARPRGSMGPGPDQSIDF